MEIFLNSLIRSKPCEGGDGEDTKLPKEIVEVKGSLIESVSKDNEDK